MFVFPNNPPITPLAVKIVLLIFVLLTLKFVSKLNFKLKRSNNFFSFFKLNFFKLHQK